MGILLVLQGAPETEASWQAAASKWQNDHAEVYAQTTGPKDDALTKLIKNLAKQQTNSTPDTIVLRPCSSGKAKPFVQQENSDTELPLSTYLFKLPIASMETKTFALQHVDSAIELTAAINAILQKIINAGELGCQFIEDLKLLFSYNAQPSLSMSQFFLMSAHSIKVSNGAFNGKEQNFLAAINNLYLFLAIDKMLNPPPKFLKNRKGKKAAESFLAAKKDRVFKFVASHKINSHEIALLAEWKKASGDYTREHFYLALATEDRGAMQTIQQKASKSFDKWLAEAKRVAPDWHNPHIVFYLHSITKTHLLAPWNQLSPLVAPTDNGKKADFSIDVFKLIWEQGAASLIEELFFLGFGPAILSKIPANESQYTGLLTFIRDSISAVSLAKTLFLVAQSEFTIDTQLANFLASKTPGRWPQPSAFLDELVQLSPTEAEDYILRHFYASPSFFSHAVVTWLALPDKAIDDEQLGVLLKYSPVAANVVKALTPAAEETSDTESVKEKVSTKNHTVSLERLLHIASMIIAQHDSLQFSEEAIGWETTPAVKAMLLPFIGTTPLSGAVSAAEKQLLREIFTERQHTPGNVTLLFNIAATLEDRQLMEQVFAMSPTQATELFKSIPSGQVQDFNPRGYHYIAEIEQEINQAETADPKRITNGNIDQLLQLRFTDPKNPTIIHYLARLDDSRKWQILERAHPPLLYHALIYDKSEFTAALSVMPLLKAHVAENSGIKAKLEATLSLFENFAQFPVDNTTNKSTLLFALAYWLQQTFPHEPTLLKTLLNNAMFKAEIIRLIPQITNYQTLLYLARYAFEQKDKNLTETIVLQTLTLGTYTREQLTAVWQLGRQDTPLFDTVKQNYFLAIALRDVTTLQRSITKDNAEQVKNLHRKFKRLKLPAELRSFLSKKLEPVIDKPQAKLLPLFSEKQTTTAAPSPIHRTSSPSAQKASTSS